METKIYSSSGFLHNCSTQELFVLTRHWLADISFFEQEIQFLQFLIKDYRNSGYERAELAQILELEAKFDDLQGRKAQLKDNILNHQNELAALLDKNPKEELLNLTRIQVAMEGDFFDFIKTFRKVKQQLFTLSQQIRKSALSPGA